MATDLYKRKTSFLPKLRRNIAAGSRPCSGQTEAALALKASICRDDVRFAPSAARWP
jgi:hypothetical protein